jgi:hypothetical protein
MFRCALKGWRNTRETVSALRAVVSASIGGDYTAPLLCSPLVINTLTGRMTRFHKMLFCILLYVGNTFCFHYTKICLEPQFGDPFVTEGKQDNRTMTCSELLLSSVFVTWSLLAAARALLRHPIVPRNPTIADSILHHKGILNRANSSFTWYLCIDCDMQNSKGRVLKLFSTEMV